MPDTPKTRAAVAKANGRLTRAKEDQDPVAEAKARKELKEAQTEYDK
jgi:hypothetical protein